MKVNVTIFTQTTSTLEYKFISTSLLFSKGYFCGTLSGYNWTMTKYKE